MEKIERLLKTNRESEFFVLFAQRPEDLKALLVGAVDCQRLKHCAALAVQSGVHFVPLHLLENGVEHSTFRCYEGREKEKTKKKKKKERIEKRERKEQ